MQDEMKKTLGTRLRTQRQQLRLTQDEVAGRAGFSSKYISEIERGCRDMPLSTLCRIVEQGLNWRIDEALFGLSSREPAATGEDRIPPMVQKLALEIAALPDEQQYELIESLSGIVGLLQKDGAEVSHSGNGVHEPLGAA